MLVKVSIVHEGQLPESKENNQKISRKIDASLLEIFGEEFKKHKFDGKFKVKISTHFYSVDNIKKQLAEQLH